MRTSRLLSLFLALLMVFGAGFPSALQAQQIDDLSTLADDIPEPPGAGQELPSPVPMIYEFVGGMMAGEFDKCLANFDVKTFLALMFDSKKLRYMNPSEYGELYSYQLQSQRNEFRFLAKIMYRLAKDAKFNYSNPRFRGKTQCKVNVQLRTTKGTFEFVVYCRFFGERWIVYDYALNGKRYSETFKAALANVKIDDYLRQLRPFYDEDMRYRQLRSDAFGVSLKVPEYVNIRDKVSPSILYSISGLDGKLLIHIQAATYSTPQTLKQVAAEIKRSIMPFKPKLYDQWRTDIAGVDIGHILFRFVKNGKTLYTHMIIIPMGQKLVVINFYHSSLQLMKHYSTIREKIFESLSLPKIEAMGGDLSIPAEDATLPSGAAQPSELPEYGDQAPSSPPVEEIPPPPPGEEGTLVPDTGLPPDTSEEPPPPPSDENDEVPPPPPSDEEIPPPPPPADESEVPPPPPPEDGSEVASPSDGSEQSPADLHGGEEPPPPPPPDDSGDVPPADNGSDVSF
ncbi:MAG TPA: hypothetical protein PLU72_09605 [Candidatus Ozemobacteraceae bacterium]|nr:hypothetical protein [Candidatus Ozemobacteraceae bacterium]